MVAGPAAAAARSLRVMWELACSEPEPEAGSGIGDAGGLPRLGHTTATAKEMNALLQTRLLRADQGAFCEFAPVDLLGRLLWSGMDAGEGDTGVDGVIGIAQGTAGLTGPSSAAIDVADLAQGGLEGALRLDAEIGSACLGSIQSMLRQGTRVAVARLLWGDGFGRERQPGEDRVTGRRRVAGRPPLSWLLTAGAVSLMGQLPLVPHAKGSREVLAPLRFMTALLSSGMPEWEGAKHGMAVMVKVLGGLLARAASVEAHELEEVGASASSKVMTSASLDGAIEWPAEWRHQLLNGSYLETSQDGFNAAAGGAARSGGGALSAAASAFDVFL